LFVLEYPGVEQKIELAYDETNEKHYLAIGNAYFSNPNDCALYLGTGKNANPSGTKNILYNGKPLRDYLPKRTQAKGKQEPDTPTQTTKKQKISPNKPEDQKRYHPTRQNSFCT
jgi:hypothetical protein